MSPKNDGGFAGLAELAVALLLLGLLLPLLGVGLDGTWRLFTTLNGRAAASTEGIVLLSAAEAQLQGAQPLGYCASPSGAGVAGPAAAVGVPMAACSSTALGPVPPDGAADWSSLVSSLPVPSVSSCGTAELGPGALVAATATCIGFFSYDGEASGSSASTSTSTSAGALSDTGPFTPPELTYLWRCAGPCPSAGGARALWLTSYAPTGGYTNAGCPSATAACSDPDWATATVAQQYVGTLSADAGAVFSYRDASGVAVAADDGLTPPAIPPPALPTVELVSVSADVSVARGATVSASTSVALTGNVFESSTNGNG
jgi:hypothetical protein